MENSNATVEFSQSDYYFSTKIPITHTHAHNNGQLERYMLNKNICFIYIEVTSGQANFHTKNEAPGTRAFISNSLLASAAVEHDLLLNKQY